MIRSAHALASARRLAAACLAVGALAAPTAVQAGPGDRQFIGIENHDPRSFQRALRAGADFVRSGRGRQFRVILANRGVILAIPGTSTVQRDLMQLRTPGLTVLACRESLAAIERSNRRRIPVIPGVAVTQCAGLRNQMSVSGWQNAPGL